MHIHHTNPYAAGGWFGQYKMTQKSWKITETLACWYSYESSEWDLSNEYTNMTGFKWFSKIFASLCFGWQ